MRNLIAAAVIGLAFTAGNPASAVGAEPTPAAPAAPESAPQLTIHIDNGAKDVDAGDRVSYQIAVQNSGTQPIAVKVGTLPVRYFTDLTAERGGVITAQAAIWSASINPGDTSRFDLSGVYGGETDLQERVALTACVYIGESTSPSICSTDIDALATGPAGGWFWAGGGVLLVLAAGGVLLWRRSAGAGAVLLRRARRSAHSTGTSKPNEDSASATPAKPAERVEANVPVDREPELAAIAQPRYDEADYAYQPSVAASPSPSSPDLQPDDDWR